MTIALESAKRTGVRAVTVAIDFGLAEYDAAADFFRVLAEVAAKFSQVKFTVIAAGLRVAGVKVSAQGDIEVVTGEDRAQDSSSREGNEWDTVLRYDEN